MVNTVLKFLIVVPAVIFWVTSCASQKDILYLNKQFNALYRQSKSNDKKVEKSIEELGEAVKANQAMQEELEAAIDANESKQKEMERILKEDQESLRLSLAQLGADLKGIKDDIQALTGRLEENAHLLKATIEEDTTKEDTMVSQVKRLSLMAEDLKSRMQSLENYVSFEIVSHPKKADSEKTSPAGSTTQKDTSPPQKKRLTEAEIYDRVLEYYKDGRYEEAIAGFQNFVESYPQSDLADNAYFWIGECHRATKKYEEAILAYQKVINGYPKGNKVPAAMLQQAFAFEKINDRTTANLVFKKLVKNFPQTREAEIASKRLSQN
jgi:tol-pal system protein YbgF